MDLVSAGVTAVVPGAAAAARSDTSDSDSDSDAESSSVDTSDVSSDESSDVSLEPTMLLHAVLVSPDGELYDEKRVWVSDDAPVSMLLSNVTRKFGELEYDVLGLRRAGDSVDALLTDEISEVWGPGDTVVAVAALHEPGDPTHASRVVAEVELRQAAAKAGMSAVSMFHKTQRYARAAQEKRAEAGVVVEENSAIARSARAAAGGAGGAVPEEPDDDGGIAAEANAMRAAVRDADALAELMEEPARPIMSLEASLAVLKHTPRNCLQDGLMRLTTKWWFDAFILACIFANCLILGTDDPRGGYTDEEVASRAYMEWVLSIIFTVEAALKIVAMGFKLYALDGFNRLDLFVVVVGWLAYIPQAGNFTVVRLFRALRPLRTVKRIPQLKTLVVALLAAVPQLRNVMSIFCLFFFIIGIFALQMYAGALTQRCYSADAPAEDGAPWTNFVLMPDERTAPLDARRCGGRFACPDDYPLCMVSAGDPSVAHPNPAESIVSFDDIGHVLLTIFTMLTREGWSGVMYLLQDSVGYNGGTTFSVLTVSLGAFFLLHLFLAVISDEYEAMKDKAAAAKERGERVEAAKKAYAALLEREKRREPKLDEAALAMDVTVVGTTSDDIVKQQAILRELRLRRDAKKARRGHQRRRKYLGNFSSGTCQAVYTSRLFQNAVLAVIFLNGLSLSIIHVRYACMRPGGAPSGVEVECVQQAVPMDEETEEFIYKLNLAFVCAFAVEFVVAFLALGGRKYFESWPTLFDFVVLLGSCIEIGFGLGGGTASVLRAFRLMRLFKLAKAWKSMASIVDALAEALPFIVYTSMLLFLLVFIFAVAGMQLFGALIPTSERANFSAIGPALLTVFQIITREKWTDVMHACVGAAGYGPAVAYFFALMVVGAFSMLALYASVLLSLQIDVDSDGWNVSTVCWFIVCLWSNDAHDVHLRKIKAGKLPQKKRRNMSKAERKGKRKQALEDGDDFLDMGDRIELAEIAMRSEFHPENLTGNALCCLSPANPLRRAVARLCDAEWFEVFVSLCILVSCVTLAVEDDGLEGPEAEFLVAMEWLLTTVFTVELVLKVVALGFVSTERAFLKDNWNCVDCFCVAVSWAGLVGSGAVTNLKALRGFRTLRSLRLLKRFEGLHMCTGVMFGCLPTVVNVCLIAAFFFYCFGILGISLLAGKFFSCNDASVGTVDDCWGTYVADAETGEVEDRKWTNSVMHFDNIGHAMFTFFQVATLEGWLVPLHDAMDAPDKLGHQPQRNRSAHNAVFFVVFIVAAVFTVLNLIIAAVYDKFAQLKAAKASQGPDNVEVLTNPAQEKLITSIEQLIRNKPVFRIKPPDPEFFFYQIQKRAFKIISWEIGHKSPPPYGSGRSFDNLIALVIILNTASMASLRWIPPEDGRFTSLDSAYMRERQLTPAAEIVEQLNVVFTVVFFAEMVLRIVGIGFVQYFRDKWNVVDFVIVWLTSVDLILKEANAEDVFPISISTFRVVRLVRVVRVIRMSSSVESMRGVMRLLETAIYTIPAVLNVVCIMLIIIYIYAVIGKAYFSDLPTRGDDNGYEYDAINPHANFGTFAMSYMTLFRMATGEGWNDIMRDVLTRHEWALVYFVSFIVLVYFLLFDMLVVVVIHQFEAETSFKNGLIPPEDMDRFREEWSKLDPDADGVADAPRIPGLLSKLKPPMGIPRGAAKIKILREMDIRHSDLQHVHFVDIFLAIAQYVHAQRIRRGLEKDDIDLARVPPHLLVALSEAYPTIEDVEEEGGEVELALTYAAIKLQNQWRGKQLRKTRLKAFASKGAMYKFARANVPNVEAMALEGLKGI